MLASPEFLLMDEPLASLDTEQLARSLPATSCLPTAATVTAPPLLWTQRHHVSNAAPGSGRGPAGIGHIEDGSDVGYAGTDRYEQLEGAIQAEIDLMLDEFEEVCR